MTQPPSFEPRSRKNRPSSLGARQVGNSKASSDQSSQSSPQQLDEWNAIARADDEEKARRAARAADAAQAAQAHPHARRTPAQSPSPRPTPTSQSSFSSRPVSSSAQAHQGVAPSPHSPQRALPSTSSARPGGSAVKISNNEAGLHNPIPQGTDKRDENNGRRPSLFDPIAKGPNNRPSAREVQEDTPASSSGDTSSKPGLRPPNFSFVKHAPLRPGRWKRRIIVTLCILAAVLIVWPVYLIQYGNSQLSHVEALSGAGDTPGTTYLIVGSDKREKGTVYDEVTTGERADTIMLLHIPESGNPALVSLPRDSYVEIPGHERAKLNSAYSLGGPKLLVQTVEQLSGLTVDHYIEVSMGGVKTLVDAVEGVNLCYDHDVDDQDSALKWTAGCHDVDGTTALAFSRMRKADPLGDIGRTARQRQVVAKVIDKAVSTRTLFSPSQQKNLVGAAASNLTTDSDSGITSLGRAGLGLRIVMKADGLMGAPPIANIAGRAKGQSVVLLDEDAVPGFFSKMRDGELTSADFYDPTRSQ